MEALTQVISGEINDSTTLETAMSTCHAVTSLLGPQISNPKIDPRLYPDLYQNYILPGMRKSGVKRIILMGTLSIKQPQDKWTFFQTSVLLFMRLLAPAILRNMHGLADLFEKNCSDLDWTIFRIAQISGDPDEHSWSLDREDMPVFSGWIGEEGWTSTIKRAALTRWLVDSAEDEAKDWIRKMPAVSRKGS